jgi:hypothetical protein
MFILLKNQIHKVQDLFIIFNQYPKVLVSILPKINKFHFHPHKKNYTFSPTKL